MKITRDGIKSLLADVKFGREVPTCDTCFQSDFDGLCACNEPADEAYLSEAAEWLAAGVTPEEMAASGVILETVGQNFFRVGNHFGLKEDATVMAAAGECAELAAAMRELCK